MYTFKKWNKVKQNQLISTYIEVYLKNIPGPTSMKLQNSANCKIRLKKKLIKHFSFSD